ncbi:NUDIX domain-containing protein [Patescibacteria group bacterium]
MTEEKNIPTHVVAVMGFVKKGNKFLVAKRSSDDPQAGGDWSVPGGKVEPGAKESILEDAVQREVEEEVGVRVKDDMHIIHNNAFYRVSNHHVIGITFLCFWKSGKARPLEDQEEIKWMTLEELKSADDMPDYMKERIQALGEYLETHEKQL